MLVVLFAGSVGAQERPDVVVADFEAESYGDWSVTGEAFGSGPAKGTLPGQMEVTGFEGERLVNSFAGGDGSRGTLTSPRFQVERKYLNFLIGGGGYPGETAIELLVEDKKVREATGPNTRPGGSERLDWKSWDVSDLEGREVRLRIVDERTGGWGHINVDQIVQSDRKREAEPASRKFEIAKQYLHLPVKNGAPKRRVKYVVEGEVAREFAIELADAEPDFVVFSDVSEFTGRELTVAVDAVPGDSKGLAAIVGSDELPGAEQLYKERLRPQFHFTSQRGWLNDPNGLVFYDGEWHLFYQHNPYGVQWGNMHWGHAVSDDLVHWKELPIGLYPKEFGDWAFSGSAVVDQNNTSGFGTVQKPALVLAYTSTGRGECIAYSNDRGRSWTEYEGNPVVRHRGRDPKLIWHEPTKRWVMVVYNEGDNRHSIDFHSSPDLKSWAFESRIDGFYECPDLFPLKADGSGQLWWVLYGADGKYMLGEFDGKVFKPETEKLQVWHGNFYAAQTYDNAPERRRVQIGWGRGIEFPGMPFNQQMTVPVELTLRSTDEGPRMFAWPVPELETLQQAKQSRSNVRIGGSEETLLTAESQSLDVEAEIEVGSAASVTLVVAGVPVSYEAAEKKLICGDVDSPLEPVDGILSLRVLVDRGSVEIFGNRGRVAMSVAVIPPESALSIRAKADGDASLRTLVVNEMKSAWGE